MNKKINNQVEDMLLMILIFLKMKVMKMKKQIQKIPKIIDKKMIMMFNFMSILCLINNISKLFLKMKSARDKNLMSYFLKSGKNKMVKFQ